MCLNIWHVLVLLEKSNLVQCGTRSAAWNIVFRLRFKWRSVAAQQTSIHSALTFRPPRHTHMVWKSKNFFESDRSTQPFILETLNKIWRIMETMHRACQVVITADVSWCSFFFFFFFAKAFQNISQPLLAFQAHGSRLPHRAKNTDSFLAVLMPEGICWCRNLSRGKDDSKFHSRHLPLTHTPNHTHQGRRAGRPRREEPELSGGPPSEDSTWNKPSKGSQTPENTPGPKQTGSLVTTLLPKWTCFCACSKKKKATVKTLYTTRHWFQECVIHHVWNISF